MSDRIVIKTNNIPRPVVYGYELSAAERAEFDYLDWDKIERGEGSATFVRYKGELYDLNDTEGNFPPDHRWFYRSDSFFSGVLFRYATNGYGETDYDHLVVATYYVTSDPEVTPNG